MSRFAAPLSLCLLLGLGGCEEPPAFSEEPPDSEEILAQRARIVSANEEAHEQSRSALESGAKSLPKNEAETPAR